MRAVAAGKQYFGSATDNGELSDAPYVAILSNTSDFGQITPGNSQKVGRKPAGRVASAHYLLVGYNRTITRDLQLCAGRCYS